MDCSVLFEGYYTFFSLEGVEVNFRIIFCVILSVRLVARDLQDVLNNQHNMIHKRKAIKLLVIHVFLKCFTHSVHT